MAMKLNQIIHEIHRKYDHTYIFINVDGTESLAFVDSLTVQGEGDSAYGEITLTSKVFGVLKYRIPTTQELIFRLPKSQVYQHGQRACIVWRKPARQWQRGITADNTGIASLDKVVYFGGGNHPASSSLVPFTLETVNAAFVGESYSAEEAVTMMGTGKFSSVAIKGNWSLVLSPTSEEEGYVLLYKLVGVARIGRTGRVLRVLNGHYDQAARTLFGEL